MKYVFSILCCLLLTGVLSAQEQKSVSVNVNKTDQNRHVKVTMEKNGETKVIEWDDQGEVPEDILETLREEGIDLDVIEGSGEDDTKEIKVVVNGGDKKVTRISIDRNGEMQEIEWDGEGEMPDEIKELMNEYEIEIEDENDGGERRIVEIKKLRDKEKKAIRKEIRMGRGHNEDQEHSFMILDGEDHDADVMKWVDEEGNESRILLRGGEGMRLHNRGGNRMFFDDNHESDPHLSDAYLGAQIGNKDEGVEILELIKDGPADKAQFKKGDVITRVNGARTKNVNRFMNLLSYYEPKDEVSVDLLREGKSKTIKVSLGERPAHAK